MPICRKCMNGFEASLKACPVCGTEPTPREPNRQPAAIFEGFWDTPFSRFSLTVVQIAALCYCGLAVLRAVAILIGGSLYVPFLQSFIGPTAAVGLGAVGVVFGIAEQLLWFCTAGMVFRLVTRLKRFAAAS